MPAFTDEILCPTRDTLIAFAQHALPELSRRVVEAHVEHCDDCREFADAARYLLTGDRPRRSA